MNKKIVLSLLTLGMLAVVASAGTWAYYQDTLTSTNNHIGTANFQAQYATKAVPGTADWKNFGATGIADVPIGEIGVINNIILDGTTWYAFDQPGFGQQTPGSGGHLWIKNSDTSPIDIYAKAIIPSTSDALADLSVKADGVNIITNGASDGTKLLFSSVESSGSRDCSLKYQFTWKDSVNQNNEAGKNFNFNVKLYVVPSGTPASLVQQL